VRYGLLQTIRDYAVEKLEASGEQTMTMDRFAEYFLALADRARLYSVEGDQLSAVGLIWREYENLISALEWLHKSEGMIQQEQRLTVSMFPFWRSRGMWPEAENRLVSALSNELPNSQLPERAKTLSCLARLESDRGRYSASKSYFSEALEVAAANGDQLEIARNLGGTADVLAHQRRFAEAGDFYNQALDIYRSKQDKRGIAITLGSLGNLAFGRKDIYLSQKPGSRLDHAPIKFSDLE
jgi:tetratricopeptide (TPR) repeat protein